MSDIGVRHTFVRFEYIALGKANRGVLRRYLQQVSGYSRAQITRLVNQYKDTGKIERRYCAPNGLGAALLRRRFNLDL